jgi:hypothetical protein
MRISFKRSGGFAALPAQQQSVELNTEELPDAQAQELKQLVEGAGPFDQLPQPRSANKVRDGYQYEIVIEDGDAKQTIKTSDGAVPEQLRPLISRLGKEVNEALRSRKSKGKA